MQTFNTDGGQKAPEALIAEILHGALFLARLAIDDTAEDHSGATVFLARNDWQLNRVKVDWPEIRLLSTREQQR